MKILSYKTHKCRRKTYIPSSVNPNMLMRLTEFLQSPSQLQIISTSNGAGLSDPTLKLIKIINILVFYNTTLATGCALECTAVESEKEREISSSTKLLLGYPGNLSFSLIKSSLLSGVRFWPELAEKIP